MRNILSEPIALRMGLSAAEYEAALAGLPRPVPTLRSGLLNSHIAVSENSGVLTNSGTLTLGANFRLETPFVGVRLILANYGAAVTLPNLAVAASSDAVSVTVPNDGKGGVAPWLPVTTGGTTSATLPAGTTAQPTYTLSDIVSLESIDPTDGLGTWHIKTRVLCPASGWSLAQAPGPTMADAEGRSFQFWYASADYVSSPALIANLTDTASGLALVQNTFLVAGVQFYSGTRCISIASFGDSLTRGFGGAADGYGGYGRLAARTLTSAACGVSYVDGSFSGQITELFAARALYMLNQGIVPHVLTIPIDSPNGYSSADRVNMERVVMDVVNKALSLGVLVVLLTSIPFGGTVADPNNASRIISSAKVRKLAARGVLVMDAAALLCGFIPTISQPAILPAGLVSTTASPHINDAGQHVLSNALVALLQPVLADN